MVFKTEDISKPKKQSKPKRKSRKSSSSFNFTIDTGKFKFKDKKKKDFYFELNTLLSSGVDIRRSLEVLLSQATKKGEKDFLDGILKSIVSGETLSAAAQKTEQFSVFEINSLSIGEETGRLTNVLEHLGGYYERKVKLKRRLVSIFTYPAFIILVTFGVLYFMLGTVVPMFIDIFKQFDAELPSLTKTIVSLSEWMPTFVYIFLLVVLCGFLMFRTQKEKDWFRSAVANFLIRLPIFGKLIKKVYLARFCQSMYLLVSSKVPLVRALELTKEMVQFYPLEKACEKMIEGIQKGKSIHEVMKANEKDFTTKMVYLVEIGEEVNALDNVFDQLSNQYDEEIEHGSSIIGTILEPLMIILIGAIVALILVAMYIPLFNLSNVISG